MSLTDKLSAVGPQGTDLRLHGPILVMARIACLGLALCALTIWVWGIPLEYAQLGTVCTTATCGDQQPVPSSIAQFQAAGTSIGFYAAYTGTLEILVALVCLVFAALIFYRRSDTWIGLLTVLFLVTVAVTQTDAAVVGMDVSPLTLPITLLQALSFACIGLFLYVFPDGRLKPHWTRFLVGPWLVLILVGAPFLPSGVFEPLLFAFLAPSVLVQVFRYRRVSTPAEQQQTKWVVLGTMTTVLGSIGIVTAQNLNLLPATPGSWDFLIVNTVLYLFTALIPLSIGLAILRAHLWDIDALINRVLVYGLLTGFLGALYAGLIIGLETLVEDVTGTANEPIALVISTLAIAALFQPIRRGIQSIIDRRFYRRKYDAGMALAAFSSTLRQEIDLVELREQLLAVVAETIQPEYSGLWLRQPNSQLPVQVPHQTLLGPSNGSNEQE
jgi:hypothetical protein